jgi:hypothetical protein
MTGLLKWVSRFYERARHLDCLVPDERIHLPRRGSPQAGSERQARLGAVVSLARCRFMSLVGGRPKKRAYSRLNCEVLS